MRQETILRLTNSHEALDFQAPGAAMRLAWYWVAQDLWSRRIFDMDTKGRMILFGQKLKDAHVHVNRTVAYQRRAARAELNHGDELARLREQRSLLQNRPFGMSIRREQDAIDEQIREIIANA